MIQKRHSFFTLTTYNLLVVIVFIAIFTMAVRVPADSDTWWHLRSGQYIVDNLTIFTTDPFSHTRTDYFWMYPKLGQVLLYGLFAFGGWGALSLGVAVLVTASFGLIWQVTPGNLFVKAFATILGAITSSLIWVARPQMMSFLLTGLLVMLLEWYKRTGSRWIYLLPLVTVLWANIHGGYAIAFMILAAYLIGETVNHLTKHSDDPVLSWRQLGVLIMVGCLSFLVVAINPHGWQLWKYPFLTVGIGALRDFIQEWQSPNFHLVWMQPFTVMLLLIVVSVARTTRRADWTDLSLVAMWTVWALFAGRNIAIFGLVTTPVLARYADVALTEQWQAWGYQRLPFSRQNSKVKPLTSSLMLNWLLLAVLCIAALVKIIIPLTPQANLKAEQASLPRAAVEFIQKEQPPGPMFNSYNWGGYLIFKLWPDYPVYIDGRTDLYDDAFIRRYLNTMAAEDGWRQTLNDESINLIFIENNSVLDKFLRDDSDWKQIYRDELAVIFVRTIL